MHSRTARSRIVAVAQCVIRAPIVIGDLRAKIAVVPQIPRRDLVAPQQSIDLRRARSRGGEHRARVIGRQRLLDPIGERAIVRSILGERDLRERVGYVQAIVYTHYHADYNNGARNTIHSGGARNSYLLLPIIPPKAE